MSDSARVQRWRQRQRQAGKEPLTIWLTTTEKLHLEDMALKRHCSPSELVQHALALVRGESLPVTATVPDTEQIRAIVQHELARAQPVTDTSTATLTVALGQMLPALVRTLLQEQQPANVSATVTDTTTTPTAKRKAPSRQRTVADNVADNVADTGPAQEPFDTTRFYLGKLCPRGHDFGGTGQSLRRQHNMACRACENDSKRARRQAKRQEVPA